MCAAYKAVKSGYQAAIMAPTAILATQHFENFKNLLEELDIKCELLISGITKKKKEDILERLKNGEIDILIGTHAIIEDNVIFKNLGLVVTDEQHRFGVKQRTKIAEKGQNPDVKRTKSGCISNDSNSYSKNISIDIIWRPRHIYNR